MSDDDRDIDVESDDEDSDSTRQSTSRQASGSQYNSQAEKRAHHNALERKRRDHIKDSFSSLRDAVPTLSGEKNSNFMLQASRAQILKKAAEYIVHMKRKISSHHQDIEDLKKANETIENQIRGLHKLKSSGSLKVEHNGADKLGTFTHDTESDTSDMDECAQARRLRKTYHH